MKDKENVQQTSTQNDQNTEAEKENVAQETNTNPERSQNNKDNEDEDYDIVESGLGIDE